MHYCILVLKCIHSNNYNFIFLENDHTYQRPLLNEHKMLRPLLPAELNEDLGDPDIAFGNYLLALMKDLPIQKRKRLQCQFIASVITAQDPE